MRGICTIDEANAYLPEFMQDYNRRFARAARNDHDAHRPLLEPTKQAKAAAQKRVNVVEYEDGRVSIRFQGIALAAGHFHKDGCVTQGAIVENKLLSGALTEIRKRQQQKEQELVRSTKTKRDKRIVADRFAGRLPPPGP